MKIQSFVNGFLIAILISGLIIVSTSQLNAVHASKNVNGVISLDTTWTKANSPYTLIGRVTVAYETVLTIEAGVTVNLDGNSLQINGVLRARGNDTDRIVFISQPTPTGSIIFTPSSESWYKQVGLGCIIENAVINASTIFILGASPGISGNSIFSSVEIDGGTPLISKNTIVGDVEYINSASPTIDNNSITGGIISSGLNDNAPSITNNNIEGERGTGLVCYGINTYVADNIIANCDTGIYIESGTVIIERNMISNNSRGISIGESTDKTVVIRNNTITNNGIGINVPGYPNTLTITYNNIEKNSDFNLVAAIGNATNNWWGTTNQTSINQTLTNPSRVNFIPFLTAPNPQATPNSNVTGDPPPVIAEIFPAWIILTLLATATLTVTLTIRKKRT